MILKGSLIEQYRVIHATRKIYSRGGCIQRYVKDVADIVSKVPTSTILDYGCGKGKQYTEDKIHESWGIMPTLFDPGVVGIHKLPEGKFDGVICTGVLEHIPELEIKETLARLASYAEKWCFLVIGVGPTNKKLLDGRQAHVTIKSPSWWNNRINAAFLESGALVWRHYEP